LSPQRDDDCAELGVGLRVLRLEPPSDGCHFGLRLLHGLSRLEPRNDRQEVAAAPGRLGIEAGGYEVRDLAEAEVEVGRHDAEHLVRLTVHLDRATDNPGIATEAALPQSVSQNHYLCLLPILLHRERATDERIHAHHGEQAGGHAEANHHLWFTVAGEVGIAVSEGRHAGEHRVLFRPIEIIGRRRGVPGEALMRCVLPHHHQLMRRRIGQRAQQYRVDGAEDGRVRTDSQCQREDRDGREAGTLQQNAAAVPEVGKEGEHRGLYSRISTRLHFWPVASDAGQRYQIPSQPLEQQSKAIANGCGGCGAQHARVFH
jgi:hypothetical protein